MTPVHITKRALAVVGGRKTKGLPFSQRACVGVAVDMHGERYDDVGEYHAKTGLEYLLRVTCPACLVLLDAEFERGGGE